MIVKSLFLLLVVLVTILLIVFVLYKGGRFIYNEVVNDAEQARQDERDLREQIETLTKLKEELNAR